MKLMNTKEYTLMCKDTPVCNILLENESIKEVMEIHNLNYAPIDTVVFGEMKLDRLNDWLSERAIPINRDGYDAIVKNLKVKDAKQYLINNYALSLSDQYWIKPEGTHLEWKDVNFFDNDYSSIEFSDATFGKNSNINTSLGRINMNIQHLRTPNASLGGALKKVWMKVDGVNIMIKGANTLHGLEPIHEALASKIAQILELDCVKYSIAEIKGKRTNQLVSVCADIADSSRQIISAYSLIRGFPEYRIKDYPSYIDFLENELNIPDAKAKIDKMLMVDYIILNEDRHLNNFGVIRNSDTLEWEDVCPLYDTGKSLCTAINEEYWDFKNGEINSFEGTYENSQYLMDIVQTSVVPHMIEELRELGLWYKDELKKHMDILKINHNTIKKLEEGFLTRVEEFERNMIQKDLINEEIKDEIEHHDHDLIL